MNSAPRPESSSRAPLIGLLLLGGVLVLISAVATQYVADRLRYHPALGSPLFGHVYPPWAWLEWQALYYDAARKTFNTVYVGFLAAVGLAFFGYVLAIGFLTRSARRHEGVHGTAHWASREEILATGLMPRPGNAGGRGLRRRLARRERRSALPAAQRPGTYRRHRADPFRQRVGARGADAPFLAAQLCRE
jgi:type IV secretory pathway TraG/TraD family ATPase VirD4